MIGSVPKLRGCACALLAGTVAGCSHLQALLHPEDHCYTKSGWLDSSNGCSDRDNYPDCSLVCPKSGLRARVEDTAAVTRSQ
jgi:hypothetical protein